MIKVLDHGYVSLIDHMGDDKRVTDSARISYATDKPEFDHKDVTLLRYLMRNQHWTPFEMVQFTFRIKLPIFVARQLVRHRTAKLNEVSARYTVLPNEMYVPDKERINPQSKDNKQGSDSAVLDAADMIGAILTDHCNDSYGIYENFLDLGMSRELSRMVLPLNTYTEWVWHMDLRNLLNTLKLRMDPHAQYEIRVYAEAIYSLIRPIVPHTCQAFEDYILNSVTLSSMEWESLKLILNGLNIDSVGDSGMSGRELGEFKVKLEKLGVVING